MPALLNTPLAPSTIVWGKLLASWAFILWLVVWPIFGMLMSNLRHNGMWNENTIFYTFYGHHLAAPLIALLAQTQTQTTYSASHVIPFALTVWFIIGALFFALACRGVSRSIQIKN